MTQNEHIHAIWCRPEVGGDVISGENVKIIYGNAVLNFEFASFGKHAKLHLDRSISSGFMMGS